MGTVLADMSLRLNTIFWWPLLLALSAPASVLGQDFIVESADTSVVDGIYQLTTRIDYTLNEKVLEALDGGVPITFELEIEVMHARAWMWDETVYTLSQYYRLEYHALTRQYLVTNVNSNVQYSYPTQQIALYAMGVVNELPMIDAHLLDEGGSYKARLRARLALKTLPSPLRFWAYLSPEWRLTSEWHVWPLQ
jgi:hypothetical protein